MASRLASGKSLPWCCGYRRPLQRHLSAALPALCAQLGAFMFFIFLAAGAYAFFQPLVAPPAARWALVTIYTLLAAAVLLLACITRCDAACLGASYCHRLAHVVSCTTRALLHRTTASIPACCEVFMFIPKDIIIQPTRPLACSVAWCSHSAADPSDPGVHTGGGGHVSPSALYCALCQVGLCKKSWCEHSMGYRESAQNPPMTSVRVSGSS